VEWSDEKIDFKVPKTRADFVGGVTQIKETLKIKMEAKETEDKVTITENKEPTKKKLQRATLK
jgi:hypothetical protein